MRVFLLFLPLLLLANTGFSYEASLVKLRFTKIDAIPYEVIFPGCTMHFTVVDEIPMGDHQWLGKQGSFHNPNKGSCISMYDELVQHGKPYVEKFGKLSLNGSGFVFTPDVNLEKVFSLLKTDSAALFKLRNRAYWLPQVNAFSSSRYGELEMASLDYQLPEGGTTLHRVINGSKVIYLIQSTVPTLNMSAKQKTRNILISYPPECSLFLIDRNLSVLSPQKRNEPCPSFERTH